MQRVCGWIPTGIKTVWIMKLITHRMLSLTSTHLWVAHVMLVIHFKETKTHLTLITHNSWFTLFINPCAFHNHQINILYFIKQRDLRLQVIAHPKLKSLMSFKIHYVDYFWWISWLHKDIKKTLYKYNSDLFNQVFSIIQLIQFD